MRHRQTNARGAPRFLALAVALVISSALFGSVGMVHYMSGQPDELDFRSIVPWLIIGIFVGTALWFMLDATEQGGRSHRSASRSR